MLYLLEFVNRIITFESLGLCNNNICEIIQDNLCHLQLLMHFSYSLKNLSKIQAKWIKHNNSSLKLIENRNSHAS